jgi:acyl-CoA dehydrogenase
MGRHETFETLGFGRAVYSEEHDAYRTQVRRFFAKEIEPNVKQWEKDGAWPAELFLKAGQAGILCAGIPTEYGGGGGDFLHHAILYEEHGYSTAGASLEAGLCTDTAAYVILNGGTEAQKQEWLPRFARGEIISEVGVTEPHSGSDVASLRTTAKRDGDDYVINGQKIWISNAPIANMLVVAAQTEPGSGAKGVGMFIVPFGTPGVSVGKPLEMMAKGCGTTGQIFLENVRVPAANVLGGDIGKGMKDALGTISTARLAMAARMLAACELAFKITVDFVKNREAFGQRVFDFQLTQAKLADMKTGIRVGRAFVDQCMKAAADTGEIDREDASM